MRVEVILNGPELSKGDVIIIPSTNTLEGVFTHSDKEWAYFTVTCPIRGVYVKSCDIRHHFRVVDPISYIKNNC